MRFRLLANSLLAVSLVLAGSASTLRATAGPPSVAPVDPPSLAAIPGQTPTLRDLVPEVRLPIRADTSATTLTELGARGLYRPDTTDSPKAVEQIRRQLARAS